MTIQPTHIQGSAIVVASGIDHALIRQATTRLPDMTTLFRLVLPQAEDTLKQRHHICRDVLKKHI